MAGEGEYPLLAMPSAIEVAPGVRPAPRGGSKKPNKVRQLERLDPQFLELQRVLDVQATLMSTSSIGVAPEHVLVFETHGTVKEFVAAVMAQPDLEWLLEHEDRVDPDGDFYKLKPDGKTKSDGRMTTCIYMVMFNQKALEQLLHVWTLYKTKKVMPRGFKAWTAAFRCLRSIRRRGHEDRLRESDLLRNALEPIAPSRVVPVEIELWFRNAERRRATEANIHRIVQSHGGKVLDRLQLQEICYHAMLVELPHGYLTQILEVPGIDLVQVDDIYLLRPISQCALNVDTTHSVPASPSLGTASSGQAICALLDGLPMENHPQLAGRIIVDDPDGWGSTYLVPDRKHGTAMASLIIHGDLDSGEPSIAEPLYVRPILNLQSGSEEAPRNRLWLDVIHNAVRRMVVNSGKSDPVAPSIRIVNLSIGDRARPFLREPSPVARLLDWLAWQHKLLFIVKDRCPRVLQRIRTRHTSRSEAGAARSGRSQALSTKTAHRRLPLGPNT